MLFMIERNVSIPILFVLIVSMIAIFLIALLIHILNSRNKANKAYRELKKHHEWLEGTVLSIGEAIIATDEKPKNCFPYLKNSF
jgi:polar amino acid transport system substrate-binding protein